MNYKKAFSAFISWSAKVFVCGLLVFGASEASAQVVVGGSVFGAGNAANVSGTATVTMNQAAATVGGDVYGGGALANSGSTLVNINEGTVTGSVYGGGLGETNTAALVNGTATVNIGNSSQSPTTENGVTSYNSVVIGGNVFGANNVNGTPSGNVTVNIYHTKHTSANQVIEFETATELVNAEHGTACFALQGVYGGGNEASYKPTADLKTTVTIFGCENTVKMVYGGGRAADVGTSDDHAHAEVVVWGGRIDTLFAGGDGHTTDGEGHFRPANIFGNASGAIHGGYFGAAFAGSNTSGQISGTMGLTLDKQGDCSTKEEIIGSLFGGGNLADVSATVELNVLCSGIQFNEVYGGCNLADLTGNVVLNFYGGEVSKVFGGSKGRAADPDHNIEAKAANIKDNPNTATVEGNVTLNLYGGTITDAFGGSNINGNIEGVITVNVLDYESNNCPLDVTNIYGAGNLTAYQPNDPTVASPVVNVIHVKNGSSISGSVFGGAYGESATVYANPQVNIGYNGTTLPAGYSAASATTFKATVAGNVYGGGNLAPVVGSTTITLRENAANTAVTTVGGDVYGGGNLANVSGSVSVSVTGGTVTKDVYGGGALADVNVTEGALTSGATTTVSLSGGQVRNLYGGGLGQKAGTAGATSNVEAKVYGPVTVGVTGGTVNNVFGCNNLNGAPQSTVHVNIENNVSGSVFGGGNLAAYTGTPDVNINSGTISGSVYGGGNEAGVYGGDVTMIGGSVRTGVYGGCNTSGVVDGNITVSITGGTVGTDADHLANVHGGGYGNGTSTTGDVEVTINGSSVNIWGDVYGGSAKGHVNDAAADATTVTLTSGTIHGNLYGGGLGDATYAALVNGAVQVTVNGGTVTGSVYGCNNANGAPQSTVHVDIYGTDAPASGHALANVFGGGNQAAYAGTPVVVVHNCDNSIGYLYGGGNAATVASTDVTVYGGNTIGYVFGGCYGANVTTDGTNVKIYGGTIDHVFGGNNQSGTVTGAIAVTVNKQTESGQSSCPMKIGEVYGGGNVAAGQAGTINIGCTGDLVALGANEHYGVDQEGIGYVYGGANAADITSGNIVLNINNGIVENVFGGNNQSGTISGSITVNIEKNDEASCASHWYVGNVFGGGNLAEYGGTTTVNVKHGTVTNVFGGGNGDPTDASQEPGQVGNTVVVIGDDKANHYAVVTGNVYGGGNAAKVSGTTSVTYNDNNASSTVGQLFGGGNAAGVESTATVNLTSGKVTGGIYGGCNAQGVVSGTATVNVTGGTVGTNATQTANVYGGGLGADTRMSGDVVVNIGATTGGETPTYSGTATIYGDVYGGSAKGITNCNAAGTDHQGSTTTAVNLYGGSITGTNNGRLFGGGHGIDNATANVWGPVTVNVYGGTVTDVYGCNNLAGAPKSTVAVNINGNVGRDVYGGGNLANAEAATHVTVNSGTIGHDVYGGGAFANTGNTVVDILGGTVTGSVFGGGLGDGSHSPTEGTVTVNIGSDNGDGTYSGTATIGGNVYGCNNAAGAPTDDVEVNIYATAHNTTNAASYVQNDGTNGDPTYAIANVFGGGKNADFSATGKKAMVNVYSCLNTIGRVFGGGDAAAVPGTEVTIDGGRFNYVFGGGNGEQTAANVGAGGITLDLHGGTIGTLVSGSNTQGTIGGSITVNVDNTSPCSEVVNDFFGGSNQVDISTDVTTTIACGAGTFRNVYGGSNKANITGSVTLNLYGGTMEKVFGGSKGVRDNTETPSIDESVPANITGNVTLNLYGGTITDAAFGGSDQNGNIGGTITVNVLDHQGDCKLDVNNIYGAGNLTAYTPGNSSATSPTINVMHVQVKNDNPATTDVDESVPGIRGNVFGGGLGATAVVTANPRVNIGYDATTMANLSGVHYPDDIDRAKNYTAIVCGSVFGGGDAAAVTGSPIVKTEHYNTRVANLYGGGNNIATGGVSGSTTITMKNGTVTDGVYGGCNVKGTVAGNTTVDILGGTVGSVATNGRIFGGGFGQNTNVDGNVHVTFGDQDGTATPILYGDLYGGSALGAVNTKAADLDASGMNTTETTTLDILSGTIVGNIFGGGLGQQYAAAVADDPNTTDVDESSPEVPAIAAIVHGKIQINVGYENASNEYVGNATLNAAAIYGCNNVNGTPQHDVYIDIYGTAQRATDAYGAVNGATFAISRLYGGGNRADYAPTNIYRSSISGLTDPVEIAKRIKKTHIYIHGCANTIDRVFGGGNAAAVPGDSVNFDGGRYGDIFGGGNGVLIPANVGDGGVYLYGKGGLVGYIYQQCNRSGSITGPIQFTQGSGVSSDCNLGVLKVQYKFSGGNEVDILGDFVYSYYCSGQSEEYTALYGGCRLGTTYGNITLIIEGGSFGTIYGGPKGDDDYAAKVKKFPTQAEVQADQALPPAQRKFTQAMYDDLEANPGWYGTGGNVTIILRGGTIGNVFGGCDINGDVEGRITIIVDSSSACPLEINNIYGGGNLASYNPDTAVSNPDYAYPYIDLRNGHVNQNVYGGGKGSTASVNHGKVTSNPYVHMHPDVANSKSFLVKGNLYGGGELGQVQGNTKVLIEKGTVKGSVFGAGLGDLSNENFGLVAKNTWVDMQGGLVERSIYGGGELASVGTFTEFYHAGNGRVEGEPKTCATGTGLAKVTLSGDAQVGVISMAIMPPPIPEEDDYGYIFCGSRGEVDSIHNPNANKLAVVGNTYLQIGGSALVTSAAYGGCENGQVLNDTYVKITGDCQIGVGYYNDGTAHFDSKYNSTQWNDEDPAEFHECSHWPYGSSFAIYDPYATHEYNGEYYYDDEHTQSARGGSTNPSNGHTFYGNVFGGGSGYYAIEPSTDVNHATWRRSAGRVNGNTVVDVDGGHILNNLYGGNEMTDVLGSCTVNFSGGTLGVPRTLSDIQAHPVSCYLFGAGKGDPRTFFNKMTNVGSVTVNVTGGRIFGSVFGGGEDGHVIGDVEVNISGNATKIGTLGTSYVDGNVFGGGRGFDGKALTAGNVGGNITVNITSGTMLGSVYGGGRLASVGCDLCFPEENCYGVMSTDANRGNIVVNISGGTIGTESPYGDGRPTHTLSGNVYGGSMGRLDQLDGQANELWAKLAQVKSTKINISGNPIIRSSVYGGGELGTVTENTEINVTSDNVQIGTTKLDGSNAVVYRFGSVLGGGYGISSTATTSSYGTANNLSDNLIAGRVYGNTMVNLTAGTISNNVFGGGKMAYVGGTTTVNIGEDHNGTYIGNAIIGNNVYGANDQDGTPLGSTFVNIYKNHRNGTTDEATYYVNDDTHGDPTYALNDVFGGGNHADYAPTGDLTTTRAYVHVYGCDNTINRVFGGGDAAAAASVAVTIDGGRMNQVFGGGNGEMTAANIGAGGTSTLINAGRINQLFGGSNKLGSITGPLSTTLTHTGPCEEHIGEFYAGSNEAEIVGELITTIACPEDASHNIEINKIYGGCNKANIYGSTTLNIYGGTFDEVFGGSKGVIGVGTSGDPGYVPAVSADIKVYDASHLPDGKQAGEGGNVTLNLYGGTMDNAYGGSDQNGNVEGKITVTVNANSDCPLVINNNVYGGGNLATGIAHDATIISPEVRLQNGTVGNNVFGAGKGLNNNLSAGLVTSNPKVIMNPDEANGKSFRVMSSIYGGGEMASVGVIHYATATEASAYNTAHPSESPMEEGDVYSVTNGNTWVVVQGGTVGPNTLSSIDINGKGDVYGGGLGEAGTGMKRNLAYVNNTVVEISGANTFIKGSVFGGGENGHVKTNTQVNISGGTIGVRIPYAVRSFDPEGPTGPTNRVYSGNVYGGGRGVGTYTDSEGNHYTLTAGRVYGNTNVSVSGGHIRHAIYGGGSLASVGTFTRTANEHLFGGYSHTFIEGTGTANVSVSGGIIGPSWNDLNTAEDGTSLLNDAGTDVRDDASRATLILNYKCLGENEGMVYGSGRGVNLNPDANTGDNRRYAELAFTNNTVVEISGTADVRGSVFGGGENGHVKGNTQVDVSGGKIGGMRLHHNGFTLPGTNIFVEDNNAADDELAVGPTGTGKRIFRGNVYGGGRGVDHTTATHSGDITTDDEHLFSSSAGRVYGNTEVNITGGKVLHNVFGGGSIASVGTYNYENDNFFADPSSVVSGTGRTDVNISGGQIGVMGENEGGVYGGGRGIAASSTSQATHLAYVAESHVHISATPTTFADVRGSVFGGGMNGHVLNDTYVKVSGGIIGGKTAADYGTWDVINFPSTALPSNPDTTFTIGGNTYNYYAGIHRDDTLTDHYGRVPSGIIVFLGNVYGGGRGVDTYTDALSQPHLSATAGRVYGNTHVLVTGGLIYHNLYGGGSIASVGKYDLSGATPIHQSGGLATVDVRGGRIGTSGRNNGRVFGSGRGMAGTNYAQTAYVNITNVTIGKSDTTAGVQPYVRGAVFGSGENGHVLDSTLVVVNRGEIGNGKRTDIQWVNKYIGNVYGGGRGVDLTSGHLPSATAGWVGTSTHVTINGGHIHNSVYGGGSLGSVGPDGRVGYKNVDVANKAGRAWVDINGGLIGIYVPDDTLHSQYGSVYGASRGRPGIGLVNGNDWSKFAFVSNTVVRVNYSTTALPDVSAETATGSQHIVGNVFGGGNNGHVNNSTYVTVTRGRIGSDGTKGYGSLEGNVFGGGSGEEKYAYYHRNAAGKYCDANGTAVDFGGRVIPDVTTDDNLSMDTLQFLQSSTINPPLLNYQALGIAVTDTFSTTAGLVYGNATMLVNGTTRNDVHVMHNVYGGGSMATVGDYWIAATATDDSASAATGLCDNEIFPLTSASTTTYGAHLQPGATNHDGNASATGICTVNIYGGTIGTTGGNNGIIFGGCRGLEGPLPDIVNRMSYFNDAHVTIGETKALVDFANPRILIYGSVFGGGENGHATGSTYVTVHDGKIGDHGTMYDRIKELDKKVEKGTATAEEIEEYNTKLEFVSNCGNVYGGGCGSDKYHDRDTTVTRKIGGVITTLMSVVDPTKDSVEAVWRYNPYCGVVYGNSTVVIDGGYVEHNVYGGGSMANVGRRVGAMIPNTNPANSFALSWPVPTTVRTGTGHTDVTVSGYARIGYSGSDNGDIFGAARGDAGDRYEMARYANVYSTSVTVNIDMPDPYNYATSTEDDIKTNVIKQYGTIVPLVAGSVYGGSENGQVIDNTSLTLHSGIVGHSLYGGGKGKGKYVTHKLRYLKADGVHSVGDDSTATVYGIVSGKVYGNTEVIMDGGHVVRNIFGGGNLGSVGKGNYAGGVGNYSEAGYGEKVLYYTAAEATAAGHPEYASWQDTVNSGRTTVTVTGGYVGTVGSDKDGLPTGNVFGGCRGEASNMSSESPRYLYAPAYFLGWVNRPTVIIGDANGGPQVYGSVYGGGQDGHVRASAYVLVNNGTIGLQYNEANIALQGTTDKENIQWKLRGNVFGAGSGLGQYTDQNGDQQYNTASGAVSDHTTVRINGGQVARNVYGGGSFASVGPPKIPPITVDATYAQSHTLVVIGAGGTVGYVPTNLTNQATFYGGDVYGGGRGLSGDEYKSFCNAAYTDVRVYGAVRGNVYGGGEDGHVVSDAVVLITNGSEVGFGGTKYLQGNVFGGGKGSGAKVDVDNDGDIDDDDEYRIFKTCGRVGGNTTVTMDNGMIHGSIFGGGRLALTGVDINGNYSTFVTSDLYDSVNHGLATINVSGGTLGTTSAADLLACDWSVGDIMGSGKGDIENYEDVDAGRVANTKVTVSGSPTIRGSVYGGGEMAGVGYWTDATGHPFVAQTGTTTVTIGTPGSSDNPVIGLAEELTYTEPDDDPATTTDNPGEWTIYEDGKIIHTITGNVFGASQGDVDISAPHWVSMSRSRQAVVTINKGTIRGAVYGGSEQGTVMGNTTVTIGNANSSDVPTIGSVVNGGTANEYVVGGVYGAGYGSDDPADELDTYPKVDDDGNKVLDNGNPIMLPTPPNDSSARTALGMEFSARPLAMAGRTYGNATVNILGGHIVGPIFGGGERACVGYEHSVDQGNTYVNIGRWFDKEHNASKPTPGATIDGDVYGANNYQGTPYGGSHVNIYYTSQNYFPTIDDDFKALSGDDQSHDPAQWSSTTLDGQDLRVQTANHAQTYAINAVYGGGNKAAHLPYVPEYATDNQIDSSAVHVWFCDENTIEFVYGGGNAANTRHNHLVIDGGRFHRVFGGGNGFSHDNPAYENHDNPNAPYYNPGADVLGVAHAEIKGGLIDSLWGGSNQKGDIGSIQLDVTHEGCLEVIASTFGGGNQAAGGGGTININCGAYQESFYAGGSFANVGTADNPVTLTLNIKGGHITNLYGGCLGRLDDPSTPDVDESLAANVYGDVIVNFYGGHVTNLFGGSHLNGNITGTITVNVDVDPDYSCGDGLQLENVYGGGQEAAYTPIDPFRGSPCVNIMNNRFMNHATSDSAWVEIKDVFGGGLGSSAQCTSYPRVIVGGFGDKKVNTGTEQAPVWTTKYTRGARVFGNVYGGGSAAPVAGNTIVMVRDAVIGRDTPDPAMESGTIYGGGLGSTAVVKGETYIGIFGKSDIKNNVYGGGNAGIVTGSTELQIGYQQQILPAEIIAYQLLDGNGDPVLDANNEPTIKARLFSTTENELPAGKVMKYRYTTDGTAPTTSTGDLFENDFVINWNQPVQAIAYLWDGTQVDSSMIPSLIAFDKATLPVINFNAAGTSATFDGTKGAKIYYTTDGTTPTTSSTYWGTIYEAPGSNITVNSSTDVIKAISVMRSCFNSEVSYVTAEKPTVTRSGNTFTITANPGERIIYTVCPSDEITKPISLMNRGVRPGEGVSDLSQSTESAHLHSVISSTGTVTHMKRTYTDSDSHQQTYRWNEVTAAPSGNTTVTFTVPTDADYVVKAIAERPGHMPSNISADVYQH